MCCGTYKCGCGDVGEMMNNMCAAQGSIRATTHWHPKYVHRGPANTPGANTTTMHNVSSIASERLVIFLLRVSMLLSRV